MRYMRLILSLIFILGIFIACPKKQTVAPVEEVPAEEEIPFDWLKAERKQQASV